MQPAWKSDYTFSPLEEPEARLEEPEAPADASTAWSPNIATLVERFNEPPSPGSDRAAAPLPSVIPPNEDAAPPRLEQEPLRAQAAARNRIPSLKDLGVPVGTLIPGLIGLAVVPMSFLFFLWWQDTAPQDAEPVQEPTVTSAYVSAGVAQPEQEASSDVALSSPERLEADAGETIAFPIAIDKADALPERSLVAVSALPHGASFSQGRPYGDTGWSLRPDEIAGLQLKLPTESATADMRVELIAGDGTVLAQSTTQLSIAPPQVASVDEAGSAPPFEIAQTEQTVGATESANETAPAEQTASAAEPASTEMTGSITPPQTPAASEPDVKVNTVKTVAVEPPREAKPYDGAMALGSPADAPQAPEEWMETKTAVDMHASAEQRSETVKVAQGGLKLRVTGRDKNWIQVNDPKSGTTGWIYNRFLKPADAPTQ